MQVTNTKQPRKLPTTPAIWLVIVALMVALGCETKPDNVQQSGTSDLTSKTAVDAAGSSDGADPEKESAESILAKVVKRYAGLNAYQDEGVLELSYRLNGQLVNEQERFQTSFQRGEQDLLSFQTFNSHVRAANGLLTCEVFDSETGNLENQKLIIPYSDDLPLGDLFRDTIANHFITGFAELPLEAKWEEVGPKLIPAPLSLLTECPMEAWLRSPEKLQRMSDQLLGSEDCFVIRSLAGGMTSDIWIEKRRHCVIKMALPLKLLAREVIASAQVTDIVLMARYPKIQLDQPIANSEFQFKPTDDSVLVRKYVSLPEPLPSDLIGKTAPKFRLQSPEGKTIDRLTFDQKTLALIWVEGSDAISEVAKFSAELKALRGEGTAFGLVYSDAERMSRSSDKLTPLSRITRLGQQLAVPVYYDAGHRVSAALKLKKIPAAVVLNGDSVIQFVQAIEGDRWRNNLREAIKRVAAGDDVALEMKNEYARYLDNYYEQLSTVSAAELLRRTPMLQVSATKSNFDLNPQLLWRNQDYKKPGNIAAVAANGFAIFDGWQSLRSIDDQGTKLTLIPLALKQDEAATMIKSSSDGRWICLFSPFNDRVHLLDGKLAGRKKISSTRSNEVRDACFCDLDQNGANELLVAFESGGIELVDPVSGEQQALSMAAAESLIGFAGNVVLLDKGRLKTLKPLADGKREIAAGEHWEFSSLTQVDNRQLLAIGRSGATGINGQGKWSAVAYDESFQRVWSMEVGSQLFERSLQPISGAVFKDQMVWAIADKNNYVQLVTGQGKWIGEFRSASQINGMTLKVVEEKLTLAIANEVGVECWDLGVR